MSPEMNNNNDRNVIDIDMQKMQKTIFRIVPLVVIIIVVVLAALNSFYMLEDKENGVILRFGRQHEVVTTPGLNFKAPFIDTVEKVDVNSIYSMEYGYRTARVGTTQQEAQYTDVDDEALVIVDGANNNASIAKIELIIQYKVSDPANFLFKVDDPEGTLRLALEDSVRSAVQALTLDEAKTQKEIIDEAIRPTLQKKMDDYEAGLEILLVATQNVQFLPNVEAAYQAKENANQYKNGKNEDAQKYFNTVIPQARAEATRLEQDAEAYRAETVAAAKAEVAQFNALYEEYLNNPEILRERYYIEAMSEFLGNNTIIIDTAEDNSIHKFYNFDDNAVKQSIAN